MALSNAPAVLGKEVWKERKQRTASSRVLLLRVGGLYLFVLLVKPVRKMESGAGIHMLAEYAVVMQKLSFCQCAPQYAQEVQAVHSFPA